MCVAQRVQRLSLKGVVGALLGLLMVLAGLAVGAQEPTAVQVPSVDVSSPSWPVLARQVSAAVRAQAWAEVFEQLAVHEDTLAGEPEFDRLLGLAAARSGQITRAVIALERALDAEPDNLILRAELASLHFRGGENRRAREMFESILSIDANESIPGDALRRIDRFLRALDERQRSIDAGWSQWVSLSYGHDSNVNSGTRLSSVQFPALAGVPFTPGEGLQATPSSVRKTQLGARWLGESLGGEVGLSGCVPQIEASAQFNDVVRTSAFSQEILTLDGHWGCPMPGRQREWSWTASGAQVFQGGKHLRDSLGLRAQHTWYRSDASMWFVSAQHTELRYSQERPRNGPRDSAQLGWVSKLGAQEQWLAGFTLAANREVPADDARRHQGYGATSLQAYARYHLNRNWSILAMTQTEMRHYAAQDAFYASRRSDRDALWSLALNRRLDDSSQLSVSLSDQRNASNQSLYTYQRRMVLLNWRLALGG